MLFRKFQLAQRISFERFPTQFCVDSTSYTPFALLGHSILPSKLKYVERRRRRSGGTVSEQEEEPVAPKYSMVNT